MFAGLQQTKKATYPPPPKENVKIGQDQLTAYSETYFAYGGWVK